MSKSMLVNVTHVEESRVAILEEGILAGYEIETTNRTSLKGNIYNAVVESTHPTLEAAFVRLGADLKGFLPLDEVNFKLLPSRSDSRKQGRIGQHLHPGQKLMAQVVREPFGGKPPTVSTYFSLPGRFLVLMPGVDSSGVSRKIEDGKQRDKLKQILDDLKPPEGFGLIVRTAGVGQNKSELQRDLRYLLRLWESIQKASRAAEFPGRVYREADLVIRTIRDFLTPDIEEVWIDSKETFERAQAFARDVMPTRAKILKLYTGDRPLFNKFNLEEQIERIYKRRVPLPSGGEIVIDGTEALTAIDVNSARSKKTGDIDENNTQTNVEAAHEIARQLRLRDLGGLIVIDFIDMNATRNKSKVEKAMREAMKGDRAKYDVTRISKLGLMEIARQRIKGAKMAASYATCPACEGYGLLKNVETAALAALRKLQTRSTRGDVGRIRLFLPTDVAVWLSNNKREEIARIERRHELAVEIVTDPKALRHENRFETEPRPKPDEENGAIVAAARLSPPAPEADPEPSEAARPDSAEEGVASTGGRRRRSRRSRRGRGAAAEGPAADETAAPSEDAAEGGETPAESVDAAEDGAEGATEESGDAGAAARGRRKRRRRRRPRPGSGTGGGSAPSEDGPGNEGDDGEVVPRGVRSDELMPAASTSSRRRRSGRGGSSNRRSHGPLGDRGGI